MAISYEKEEKVIRVSSKIANWSISSFLLAHGRLWMAITLMVADFLSLTVAGIVALGLRSLIGSSFDPSQYYRFIFLVFIFLGVYFWRGLYPGVGLGAVEEMRRLSIATSLVFLTIAAFTFVIQSMPVYSRLSFAFTWVFALGLVPLGRAVVRQVCTQFGIWGELVAVVGQPDKANDICRLLKLHPKIGLRPTPVCAQNTCPAGQGRAAFLSPGRGLHLGCTSCSVERAKVALVVYSDYSELEVLRDKYRDTFERVILINYRDNGLSLSGVSVREFGGLAGFEVRQNLLNRYAQTQKRLIDIIVSGLGLVALAPFFAIMAVLIYLDSPGPVFYWQPRLGKGDKKFGMLKFRSMHVNADELLKKYLVNDPVMRQEWDQYQKLKNDPRITRMGKFIRRFSIDELPQLWNVFTGEMSLVGPRPIIVNQKALYGKAYEHYIRVTPGMTGLWQVSGRNKTTFVRRTEFDVQYVMNWSIWLDIYILVRTIWVVIRREGAG